MYFKISLETTEYLLYRQVLYKANTEWLLLIIVVLLANPLMSGVKWLLTVLRIVPKANK